MKGITRPAACALAFCLAPVLSASADTVVLNNGDRISGKVASSDTGGVRFFPIYGGEIAIPWKVVAKVEMDPSVYPLVEARFSSSGTPAASAAPAVTPTAAPAAASAATSTAPPASARKAPVSAPAPASGYTPTAPLPITQQAGPVPASERVTRSLLGLPQPQKSAPLAPALPPITAPREIAEPPAVRAPQMAQAQQTAPPPQPQHEASGSYDPHDPVGEIKKTSGEMNIGLNASSGNTDATNLHADGRVAVEWPRDRARLGFEARQQKDSDDNTTEGRAEAYALFDHFFLLDQNLFMQTNLKLEHDRLQDLKTRFSAGPSLGYRLFTGKPTNLELTFGINYVHEEFDDETDSETAAFRWSADLEQQMMVQWLSFFHRHELFIDSSDQKDLIAQTETGFRFPFNPHVQGIAAVEYDFNNRPSPGQGRSDTIWLMKMGYRW